MCAVLWVYAHALPPTRYKDVLLIKYVVFFSVLTLSEAVHLLT